MEVVQPEVRDDVLGGPLPATDAHDDEIPVADDDAVRRDSAAPAEAAPTGDADVDDAYRTAILGAEGEGGGRPLSFQVVQSCLSNLKHAANGQLAYTTATLNSLSLTTVAPLAKFPCLQKILLDLNQLRELSPLGACKSLVTLSVAHNKLDESCFAALDNCKTTLQYLDISGNDFTTLRGVGRFRYLTTLLADNNGITALRDDPAELGGLKSLWRLSLAENDIRDIAPTALSHSPLRSLNLTKNHLVSLAPLLPLAGSLTSLLLEENSVMHIAEVTQFQRLVVVELAANNIYDMSETGLLAKLPLLRTATLVGNPLCSVNAVPEGPIDDDDDGDVVRADDDVEQFTPGVKAPAPKRKRHAPARFVPAASRVAALREEKNAPYEPLAANEEDEAELEEKDEELRYRLQVLWRVPQLATLDGAQIAAEERAEAQNLVGGVDREQRRQAQRLLNEAPAATAAGSATQLLRRRAQQQ